MLGRIHAMNRRSIIAAPLHLAAANLAGAALAQTEDLPAVSSAARALYRRALVFDANCAPPLPDNLPMPQSMLDVVRASGVTAVKSSLGGIDSSLGDTV